MGPASRHRTHTTGEGSVLLQNTHNVKGLFVQKLQSGSAVVLVAAEAMPVSAIAYVMVDIAPIDIDMRPACVIGTT